MPSSDRDGMFVSIDGPSGVGKSTTQPPALAPATQEFGFFMSPYSVHDAPR